MSRLEAIAAAVQVAGALLVTAEEYSKRTDFSGARGFLSLAMELSDRLIRDED